MNKVKYVGLFFVLMNIFTYAYSAEPSSGWMELDRYNVSMVSGSVALVKLTGWGFESCPNARHAVLLPSSQGFEEAFSSMLMAYTNKTKFIIHANCDVNNEDVAYVTSLTFEDRLQLQ